MKTDLTSFEFALRDAGIAGTNLVLISSIFPPHAKLISRNEGLAANKTWADSIYNLFQKSNKRTS